MSLLIISPWTNLDEYTNNIRELMSDLEIRIAPDTGPVEEVEFVLVWNHEPGELLRFPNLKFICSMGAGVDHMFRDDKLPPGVPLVRLVDKLLATNMAEYVLLAVLRYHRQYHEYRALQLRREWKVLPAPRTETKRVGIMGLGNIGGTTARLLVRLGFDVAGWDHRPVEVDGVELFHGDANFIAFLERTEILSCLLPLTPETRGILNARAFSALPEGAYVINSARGGHLVEEDLLAALDSGHIAGATLDVFNAEPLPDDHPLWTHPKVVLTPHASSITIPRSVIPQIVENVRRARAGLLLNNIVDPVAGY
jgi:glyoxylate/hydroxypyruvate reductase A